jgi:hypothetical protein
VVAGLVQLLIGGVLAAVSLAATVMPSASVTSSACESMAVEGHVAGLASSIRYEEDTSVAPATFSLALIVQGDTVFVDLAPDATVSGEDGSVGSANQLLPGRLVRVYGVWQSSDHVLATHIDATPSPSPTEAVCTPGGSE